MKKLKMSQAWLTELLPEGLPHPSSTLISGPGGSGKPLVGFGMVNDWLKSGGNVVFIPLQYPETTFVKTSLRQIYNVDADSYSENTVYVKFEHEIDSLKRINQNTFEANLLRPDVWDEVIRDADSYFDKGGDLGTMVFASALNLLLFSPAHRESNLTHVEKIIREDKERSYIISVSTSAFVEDIRRWEEASDNLMFTRMEKAMKLHLSIDKIENRKVPFKEVIVPVEKEILEEIKNVAESVRKREIPKLRKI
jgi:archaellum biogenesis ATPase FlaH